MTPETILSALVGIPSLVGRPNGDIIAFVRDFLAGHGIAAHVLPGPEGDRSNLFATIGPADRPGLILSGHLDVVPAQEPGWRADPFILRAEGERLIGRGACDMKGFVAAVLSCVPDLVARPPARPVHLAFSYDEEAGARGAPHMIARLPDLCAPPFGCVVGEPSNLTPILAHKGKATVRLTARGIAGHSSRPDLGQNAIHALAPVIAATVAQARALENGPLDPAFAPPWSTMQIGVIRGGSAVNIIPESAEMDVEARAIGGVDPQALFAPIRAVAAQNGVDCTVVAAYPALSLPAGHEMVALLARVRPVPPIPAVSYGTEAGLFQQAGIPSLICGPGDISRAHKAEEYLTRAELHDARRFVLDLVAAAC